MCNKFLERRAYELSKLPGFDAAYGNGGLIGLKAASLSKEDTKMMEALGLEDGNLITAVNGKDCYHI